MYHFTGCSHFGHANIIKYCDRPFLNVGEMDQQMVVDWNKVVDTGDTVWHLSDFHLGQEAAKYFIQLNGTIHILSLPWHHDRHWLQHSIAKKSYFTTRSGIVYLAGAEEVLEIESQFIHLSHYPLATGQWDRAHYGSIHLHSHSHSRGPVREMALDVGVDNAHKLLGAYRPFSLEEVISLTIGLAKPKR